MKSPGAKTIVSISILLLTCGGIVYYLLSHRELLDSLRNISFAQVIILLIVRVLYTGTYGLYLKIFTRKFNIHLTPMEWFGLPFITTMGNQLTPFAGGVIVRAMYLKHKHSLPYARFATLLVANYLITYCVVGFTGLLACFLYRDLGPARWIVTIFFLSVVLLIGIIVSLPPFLVPGENIFVRTVNNFLEGWSLLKRDNVLLASVGLVAFASIMLNGMSFWLACYALNFKLMLQVVILLSLLPFFLLLVYITPGNLGIQEVVISLTSGLIGAGLGKGLLIALLIRATTLVPVFILGPIFCIPLIRNLGSLKLDSSGGNMSHDAGLDHVLASLKYLFKMDKDR